MWSSLSDEYVMKTLFLDKGFYNKIVLLFVVQRDYTPESAKIDKGRLS